MRPLNPAQAGRIPWAPGSPKNHAAALRCSRGSPWIFLLPTILQRQEPMLVQALLPEASIEHLDYTIVRWLSGNAEVQIYFVRISPKVRRSRCELGTIVHTNGLRASTITSYPFQNPSKLVPREPLAHLDRHALPLIFIHHRQNLQFPPVLSGVAWNWFRLGGSWSRESTQYRSFRGDCSYEFWDLFGEDPRRMRGEFWCEDVGVLLEDFVDEGESVLPSGGVLHDGPCDVVGVLLGDEGFGEVF